jgi:UPF0755 protein
VKEDLADEGGVGSAVDAEGHQEAEESWQDEEAVETFAVRHRFPRWLTWLVLVVVLGLVVGAVGIVWVRSQIDPSGRPGAAVTVTIPARSSTARIASDLGRAGVIHSPTLFRLYVKVKGAGPLLAGTYTLHRNSRYDTVISTLQKGPPVVDRHITIPEGFTLEQIAARVGTLPGLSAQKFLTLATNGQVRSPFEPPGVNTLEGLLYPATYDVRPSEDETSILQRMVDAFDQTAADLGLAQAAPRLGLSPYQVVIVASLVEREAKLDGDRGPVASVIYNRLHKDLLLQVDATLIYGEHLTDAHQIDKQADTPYNTYRFKGLPPTPIASPGTPSLQAAAAPPQDPYLYYVLSDPDGKLAFAVTDQQFNQLKAQAKAKGLL